MPIPGRILCRVWRHRSARPSSSMTFDQLGRICLQEWMTGQVRRRTTGRRGPGLAAPTVVEDRPGIGSIRRRWPPDGDSQGKTSRTETHLWDITDNYRGPI